MFEGRFFELLIIFVLALVVLGPEKLPRVVSEVGRWVGRARAMARQFREQLEEEVVMEETRRTQAPRPRPEPTPAPPPQAQPHPAESQADAQMTPANTDGQQHTPGETFQAAPATGSHAESPGSAESASDAQRPAPVASSAYDGSIAQAPVTSLPHAAPTASDRTAAYANGVDHESAHSTPSPSPSEPRVTQPAQPLNGSSTSPHERGT